MLSGGTLWLVFADLQYANYKANLLGDSRSDIECKLMANGILAKEIIAQTMGGAVFDLPWKGHSSVSYLAQWNWASAPVELHCRAGWQADSGFVVFESALLSGVMLR
jgi:hypothetical protein